MSHHFDSPTAIEDGRLNLCDVYVFPGSADHSTLVLTTNPDSARSAPTTFRPDALYEFVLGDQAFRMRFTEPDQHGRQRMTALHASGTQSHSGFDGTVLGSGDPSTVFALAGGGSAWFGLASDPFWADGVALMRFHQALAEQRYDPTVFTAEPANLFAGRNVTAIALQLPNAALGTGELTVWARISLYGHAPQRQVSRMGNPMLRPLFFPQPLPEVDELNAGSPGSDVERYAERLRQSAAMLAKARGLPSPADHAAAVATAFLPDVLRYQPGQPAHYHPGTGNGRALHDDAFGIALSVFNGGPLAGSSSPLPVAAEFPYLAPANHDDIPALADLFGLREHQPSKTE